MSDSDSVPPVPKMKKDKKQKKEKRKLEDTESTEKPRKDKKSKKSKRSREDIEEVPVQETPTQLPHEKPVENDEFDLSSLKKTKSADNGSSALRISVPPNKQENTRIFVGNLPFKVTDELLHEKFDFCGEFSIHYVTDKTSGQFYGTAFLDFSEAKAAAKAVSVNGKEMLGRPLKVGYATGVNRTGANYVNSKEGKGAQLAKMPISEKPEGTTTVFVGNLSFSIDEDTLGEHFSKCGTITQIRWVEKDGEFKGCGFIEFERTEETDEAVKLNGTSLMGRPIRVDYSGDRPLNK